ncbi:MAG: MaoC family dehydratase [Betaproteobacteria bacterium]|nr:MaoC family dehydratase [Betaproteobacteria bacterium]
MTKFAHELVTGDTLDPLSFTVTPEWNQQYCYAQEDFDPRYLAGRDAGSAEVHPTLLLSMSAYTKSPSFRLAPGTGSIMGEQSCTFLSPAAVGKRLDVTFHVVATYEKRDRRFEVVESTVTDEDGTLILRRESHLTFGSNE